MMIEIVDFEILNCRTVMHSFSSKNNRGLKRHPVAWQWEMKEVSKKP